MFFSYSRLPRFCIPQAKPMIPRIGIWKYNIQYCLIFHPVKIDFPDGRKNLLVRHGGVDHGLANPFQ